MGKNRWRKPIDLVPNGGRANVWAYVSRTGKSIEVYFQPLDKDDMPILSSPISAKISFARMKHWVAEE